MTKRFFLVGMTGGVVQAPAQPTGLTATPITTARIDLAWTDNATTETAYKIYRSTDGVTYAQVGTDQAADANSYSDTTSTAGTTYYYKVAAVNAGGETLSAAATSNTLLLGIKSYWKLGEAASADRSDSVGSNALAPSVSNPTQEVGIINNAAGFVTANSQRLTATLTNVPTGAQAHGIAMWIYPTTNTGARYLWMMGTNTSSAYDHIVYLGGTDLYYSIEGAGGAGYVLAKATNGIPTANQWYFIAAWWAGGSASINLSINNGVPVTVALGGCTPDAAAFTFSLGATVSGASYFSGRIDELGIWNRAFEATELTALYNGGAGRTHPF